MVDKTGEEDRGGAFARVRHSIRAQYSLATALFLLMVLGLFYVGGRVVLVHLIREAEQQVKEIGLDISRLAYRNAERVKQRNLASSGAVVDALAKGAAPESLLASDEFSDLSLVVVYSSGGKFLAGAVRSQPLAAALKYATLSPPSAVRQSPRTRSSPSRRRSSCRNTIP